MKILSLALLAALFCGCGEAAPAGTSAGTGGAVRQNDLGGLSPEKALEYMKKTDQLVILDVATANWHHTKHFDGAVNIPVEELNSKEEKELYRKVPVGRPVILHCRRGMVVPGAYRTLKALRPDIPEISYIDGAPLLDEYNSWKANRKMADQKAETKKLLGGLKPDDALEYMKKTENLVIVEVREPQWIGSAWFTGAIRIPWSEMEKRYAEIPKGRPVLLNCGAGVMAPRAYRILTEKRPDIPQLSYIAGAPLFDEYNNWKKTGK